MAMPTKMPTKAPTATMEHVKGAPTTFADRKAIAKPGDLFIAPDSSHVWLVVRVMGAQTLGLVSVPMDGTPQTWNVQQMADVNLTDEWKLHPMDHVHFTYFDERKGE
jgi:hypothetical protein